LIVAIAYMISNAFNTSELKAWALNEFWQAVATATIVLAVFVIAGMENQVFNAAGFASVDTNQINPQNPVIASAHTFLIKAWRYTLGSFVAAVAGYSESASILRQLELFSKGKGHSLPLIPGTKGIGGDRDMILYLPMNYATADFINGAFGKIFGFITSPLSASLGVMVVQIFILCAFDALGLTILLPLGVVLRSVPFCRGIGTAFIAITIGFYLIYPLVLLFNEKIVLTLMQNDENWWANAIPPSAEQHLKIVCVTSVVQFTTATSEAIYKSLGTKIPTIGNAIETVKGSLKTFNWLALLYSASDAVFVLMPILLQRAAFIVVVLGVLLPFISIVITFGVTREIAKILGSDINLNTLLKVL